MYTTVIWEVCLFFFFFCASLDQVLNDFAFFFSSDRCRIGFSFGQNREEKKTGPFVDWLVHA